MSVFFHSLRAKNIYFHWKESRRKIMDGWILLSLGVVMGIVSLWVPAFTLILIGAGSFVICIALAVVLVNYLTWRNVMRSFKLSESFVTLNFVTQKLSKFPLVIVYNHDNPTDAIAFFSALHSYIIPLSSSTNARNAVEQLSDEIKRLLPYPWQNPIILETVTNPLELDARLQKLSEDCTTGAVTNVLMETAWRFAKATRYFPIFGQPMPPINTLHATPGQKVKPISPSKKSNQKKNQRQRSAVNYQRLIWPIFICLFILLGIGIYYFGNQLGPTNNTTYLEEFQIWLASSIPLEYHSQIGLGTLEDNPELNITAQTSNSTPLYDNVGGGQITSTSPAGVVFDVVQEEQKDGVYWYYLRKSGTMGWAKGNTLSFKHVLPANYALSVLPFPHQRTFSSPDRMLPYAIKRIYHFRKQVWWEIWTFSPLDESSWLLKGDNQ